MLCINPHLKIRIVLQFLYSIDGCLTLWLTALCRFYEYIFLKPLVLNFFLYARSAPLNLAALSCAHFPLLYCLLVSIGPSCVWSQCQLLLSGLLGIISAVSPLWKFLLGTLSDVGNHGWIENSFESGRRFWQLLWHWHIKESSASSGIG